MQKTPEVLIYIGRGLWVKGWLVREQRTKGFYIYQINGNQYEGLLTNRGHELLVESIPNFMGTIGFRVEIRSQAQQDSWV